MPLFSIADSLPKAFTRVCAAWLVSLVLTLQLAPARSGEPAQPQQSPALPAPSSAPAPSKFTKDGMPVDDPNYRKNYVPLGIDEFRVAPQTDLSGPHGEIIEVSRVMLPDRGPINCTAVKIRLRNATADPFIVEGGKARATISGKDLMALSEQQALKTAGGQFTPAQIKTLAAVGILTIGYCEPILQDRFTTSKKDWTKSYGQDERRRKLEARRLSRRIILPGEDTDGVLLFPGTDMNISRVVLPMTTYPEGNDAGVLNLEPQAKK